MGALVVSTFIPGTGPVGKAEWLRYWGGNAGDEASMAAAAKLDRRYLMVYELTDSLRGGTEWWQMSFDPEIGVRFSLQEPVAEPDLKFMGDYREYIGFMKKLSAGEANEADMPVTTSGNAELMDIVGETFGAARQAATIKAAMPDIYEAP